jgi:hypothetical protein
MDELILPYRSDWRELHRVLDYCKGKGAERAALDARFGGGESLRETLNALEQLRLIQRSETGDVRLTGLGDRLAYAASDAETRLVLVEAMLLYWPYRVPLERALDDNLTVLDAPAVERIWQVDMRLAQPRNRVEEARTFFFRLADDAGLGTYRRGVRGQTTRLEIADGALATVRTLLATLINSQVDCDLPAPEHVEPAPPAEDLRPQVAKINPVPEAEGPTVDLTVHVDMSGWELDKIEAFLTMIGYLDRP